MRRKSVCLISLVLVLGLASSVSVATTWTNGTGNQKWQEPGNWDAGVPGIADRAYISMPGADGPIIGAAITAVANRVYIGRTADGCLKVAGGTLTVGDRIYTGYSGNSGTIDIDDGSITVTSKLIVGYMGGSGTVNMTGGVINAGYVDIPGDVTSSGHLQLDGGLFTCDGAFTLSAGGTGDITRGVLKLAGNVTSLPGFSGWGVPGGLLFGYDPGTNMTTVTADPTLGPFAYHPSPSDMAEGVGLDVVLSWSPGSGAASHDVYFGTNWDNVNDANNTAGVWAEFKGNQDATIYEAGVLELDTTYYWRIDEVNEPIRWKGKVWSFTTDSGFAKNPSPGDKAEEVPREVILIWSPGAILTATHDVYSGTSWNDVNEATSTYHPNVEYSNVDVNSYDPCGLDWNTTYYWRVDEVNGPDVWKGDIWSFTTVEQNITFFVVADTHYGVSPEGDAANKVTIDRINALPGIGYPANLGGGVVQPPRGVLVAGDLVHDGEDVNASDEWSELIGDWGVNGEGRINYPVYEGFGNQDGGPASVPREGVISRNLIRPGLTNVSSNGLHYSWDWDQVHFVNLNLYPGSEGPDNVGLNPEHSLEFLIADLVDNVGDSGRPVVLYCHYGFDDWGLAWWSTAEQTVFYNAIKDYNIIGIFHGHSHATAIYSWNGIDIYSVPATQYAPGPGKFLVVNIQGNRMVVVERAGDLWGTSSQKTISFKQEEPADDFTGIRGLDKPFTIIALPDTQIYCRSFPHVFYSQTEWTKDNKDALNCKFVLHEGDIVDSAGSITQWQVADQAMTTLDGEVPYCFTPGNHDTPTGLFNTYFPFSRYESEPWYGGHMGNDNDNSYHFFNAGSMQFMIVCLEFAPSDTILQWANDIVTQHPDHRVIVLTHSYLNNDGETRTVQGENVWQKFVRKHKNIFLVLCGHLAVARKTSIGDPGNTVYELLADYQGLDNGGNGWLRIMKFVPSKNIIEVRTYSTFKNKYFGEGDGKYSTPEDNNFDLPYLMEYALTCTGYELVSQERVSDTEFEYCFRMKVKNLADKTIEDITLELISAPENITVLNDKVFFSSIPAEQEALSDDTFIVRIDRQSAVDVNDIIWQVSEDREGDITGDGSVDAGDLLCIASNWLSIEANLLGNLYKDQIIDFKDFAIFGERWQECGSIVVNITTPTDGDVFNYNEIGTIEIEADALSVDGSVVKAEFFANGNKIGEDSNSNDGWKTNWQNFTWDSSDAYSLTAKIMDDNRATETSPAVEVTVTYELPVVNITSPMDGAVLDYNEITTIEIEAETLDGDGTVVKVEFLANGSRIGEDNDGTDGWKINWQKDTQDTYILSLVLTAKATDDNEATKTSPPVAITVVSDPPPK